MNLLKKSPRKSKVIKIIEKISTGINGLDDVLNGGIPELSVCLLAGNPGTGKTILAQQILFNVNNGGSSVVFISTSSEPQIKILRYQKEMEFFNINNFMSSFLYQDMSNFICRDKINGLIGELNGILKNHKPRLIAIDSFKSIADLFDDDYELRKFVSNLNLMISAWDCSALLVGEYNEDQLMQKTETAIVDGIIYLSGMEEKRFQKRFLRVLKMRGTSYQPGENFFEITDQGINVYPRLMYNIDHNECDFNNNHRQTTGVAKIDDILGGGIPRGTSTLLCGDVGTCKTLFGITWLLKGASGGENSLLINFEETSGQIEDKIKSFNWERPDNFLLHCISPVELDLDKHIHEIIREVLENQVTRVVIDSIESFETSMSDKSKIVDYLGTLISILKSKKVSLILICKSFAEISTRQGISFMADNVIMTKYVRINNMIRKSITVLKLRNSRHDSEIKEVLVTPEGMEIKDFKEGKVEFLTQGMIPLND